MKQNRVKKRLNSCDKFTFSIEFQLEVLRFLVQGKEALLYVPKIKPGYFTLIEHSIENVNLSQEFNLIFTLFGFIYYIIFMSV